MLDSTVPAYSSRLEWMMRFTVGEEVYNENPREKVAVFSMNDPFIWLRIFKNIESIQPNQLL